MFKPTDMRVAIVFGVPLHTGGLGVQSANAVRATTRASLHVSAFGPATKSRLTTVEPNVTWHAAPSGISAWRRRYTRLRWEHGKLQYENDVAIGKWAVGRIDRDRPDLCYVFTQVGLETLQAARKLGIPSVLESPNGHIRAFREVYRQETGRWCNGDYRGHPTEAMVARVEKEYELADYIRVSSEWARSSLIAGGVPPEKVHVLQQPVDLDRYQPPSGKRSKGGPLRVVFVGSLDLRKGFVYLLDALKRLDQKSFRLQLLGATGDRCCAQLLAKHSSCLNFEAAPGNAVAAYHGSELFVLPTLEDGSPFAVAEAMASGLPAIVTDACGSAEWIEEGLTGWVVPARNVDALAQVLEQARLSRASLPQMGQRARRSTEKRAGPQATIATADWLISIAAGSC
jgi:glycosyltransferase involved in cell wall biosynthesis